MTADRPLLVSRRAALLVGASALLFPAAGCAQDERRPANLKTEQLLAALRDQSSRAWLEAGQATLLADRDADHAAALREVADTRRAHAETLDAQVAKLAPPTTSASPAASGSPSKNLPEPGSLDQFKASLAESQRLAGELAKDSSGYQAGLAAAVSAAIRALLSVTLAEAAQ